MASSYSSNYKLEKMATGANANTWGTNTNNNLDVLDAFGAGYIAKSVAGSSNITLTTGNADPSAESANKVIELTGALTGDIVVFVPAVEGEYVFFNNTTGSQTLTIAATGHTANGIAIAQGAYSHVYNDGSANYKMYNAVDKLGATTFKDTVTAGSSGQIILRTNGAVTATTFTGDGSNLSGVDPFPSGTKQVFYQASAPTGWTQDTAAALGNAAMRVVVGTGGGTGGSDTFQTTFGSSRSTETKDLPVAGSVSGTVGATTLSTPTIASHTHTAPSNQSERDSPQGSRPAYFPTSPNVINCPTSSAGGGGSHTHPFSGSLSSTTAPSASFAIPAMDLKFANVIIAAKD
jgi:hypothetical protein|tara:strand:+ start:35 stop:1078 length:1044 start_codon:yes stop_codon:yes gene_type:complete